MHVISWNRTPQPGETFVALDDLLMSSDVISLHLALNDETLGFLGPARVARMKPGVVFINTARGALIDETAFIEALRSGHIRHAGLDVFHAEPLRADHPLALMDNVTVTAHAGFRTLEATMTLLRQAIDIVRGIVE
jgi:D-3-phosphoglycerate dehydrogenase / 2-oxoglutarate reductase